MKKIQKFALLKLLEIFKEEGCNTIDDIIELLNKEIPNDDDVVFQYK